MQLSKAQLKQFTLSHSLFTPTTLSKAIEKMQCIQIDPIRSPAPAQDLILRHRVEDYHVGDISSQYQALNLEEDYLFAHSYLTREVWQLLHPRPTIELTEFDQQVWQTVQQLGEIFPNDLDTYFEKTSVENWWGGSSRATKMSMERLHYYGLVRVSRRQKNVRIYQSLPTQTSELSEQERLRKLIMIIVNIMAPVTTKTLSQAMHRLHRHFGNSRTTISDLVKTGELEQQTIDNLTYLWPASLQISEAPPSQTVKFLAPFDPVVRDRFRFEQLWGWRYQFEAYVPANKRIRGYYAMPVLFGSEMIGWVNLKVINKELTVDLGFVDKRPTDRHFEQELEAEIERMKMFLN